MPADILAPPKGFVAFQRSSPLVEPWRPIYALEKPGRLVLGAYLREPHTNSRGTAHGGFIAALADWAMGLSCSVRLTRDGLRFESLWTASLAVDYLAAIAPGAWVAFDTVFVRTGRTLCHAECDIAADWQTAARARAVFRVRLADHVSSSS